MEASTAGSNAARRASVAAHGNPSDSDLVEAARVGKEDGARQLVARHWDSAHRAAYLITGDNHAAEDVAQEALLRALRSLGRFESGRDFAPWVHRIATNAAIDWVRSRRARPDVVESVEQPEPSFTELEQAGDARLAAALSQLSVDDRAALDD